MYQRELKIEFISKLSSLIWNLQKIHQLRICIYQTLYFCCLNWSSGFNYLWLLISFSTIKKLFWHFFFCFSNLIIIKKVKFSMLYYESNFFYVARALEYLRRTCLDSDSHCIRRYMKHIRWQIPWCWSDEYENSAG